MRKIFSAALALVCIWFATPARAALPSGYTELEYIESTGTQYIDTGIQKGRFVHDIAFTVRDNKNLMGNSAGAGSYWGQNRGNAEDGFEFGSSKIFTSSLIRQTVVFNTIPTKTTLTANGETVASASSVASSTYYVFAINGATDLYRASAKLWSLKIYDGNDELIKNLVPAKNPDGKIGMYDTVSGEFFENKGEGTFIAGPVVEIKIATTKYNESAFGPLNTALANAISVVDTVVSNTITQAGRIATLQTQKQTRPNDIADDNEKCPAGKKCLLVEDASGVPHWYEIVENASLLPNGYTELAYLTSGTDGQYIDTGILFDPTKNFRVVGNFINPDATLRKVILGNYYSQQIETYYSIELYSDGKFRNYMSADAGSAFNIYSPTAVPADTIAYFDTSYDALAHQTTTTLRYGTTEQTYSGATPETTTVAVHTLKLFNDKRNSSPVYNYPVSIGAVQIYIDDILAHHYVPARRESDGVLGMYDTVSGQFFTNSGDGEFIAGDPVVE